MSRRLFAPVAFAVLLAAPLRASDPSAVTAAATERPRTRVLDVSMNGAATFSSTRGGLGHIAESKRGDTFLVLGGIYGGGTIPPGEGTFDPGRAGKVGSWLCRGAFNALTRCGDRRRLAREGKSRRKAASPWSAAQSTRRTFS